MSGLQDIPVKSLSTREVTGNLEPILYEIKYALAELIETKAVNVIDLQNIPISEAELSELLEILGKGEIEAELDVLGKTTITETQYSGVWRVCHYAGGDVLVGHFIEICFVPELLTAQEEDVRQGLEKLNQTLASEVSQ